MSADPIFQTDGRRCERCSTTIAGKYTRFCDPCRSKARRKRVKYVSNDLIDQRLRDCYQKRLEKRLSTIPGINELARRVGWPSWALKRRACVLGLGRTKEPPWTEPELQILQRFAWMCDSRIRLKLKAAGFERTATAIHLKLKRTAAKQNTPYFTATGLALCFGVDSHVITRWIRLSYLKAKRRETERTEAQGGDMWMIHEADVRRFVLSHPMEFDIRKVDQLWFLNLITNGRICA